MISRHQTPPDEKKLVVLCVGHLRSLIEFNKVFLEQILALGIALPLEIGELCEDAANELLDAAEEISARHRAVLPEARAWPAGKASVPPSGN
jgi:hypothetical protein